MGYRHEPANLAFVRTIAIGLLFVAEIVFLLTSGPLTAIGQPVNGLGTDAGAGRPGRARTDTKAKKGVESSRVARGRVPCDQVTSRLDRDTNARNGRTPDMSVVAEELGTSVVWVERCMLAYGRRPKRPGTESDEARQHLLESWEADEPEESGPEDIEEAGAPYRREQPERPTTLNQLKEQDRAKSSAGPPP